MCDEIMVNNHTSNPKTDTAILGMYAVLGIYALVDSHV